jgi:hypothetical protein
MNIDPENLPEFQMPLKLMDKIYEFSGNSKVGKGVLIVYLSQDGSPVIFNKSNSKIIEMGVRKAVETYLEGAEVESLNALGFLDKDDIDPEDEDSSL